MHCLWPEKIEVLPTRGRKADANYVPPDQRKKMHGNHLDDVAASGVLGRSKRVFRCDFSCFFGEGLFTAFCLHPDSERRDSRNRLRPFSEKFCGLLLPSRCCAIFASGVASVPATVGGRHVQLSAFLSLLPECVAAPALLNALFQRRLPSARAPFS